MDFDIVIITRNRLHELTLSLPLFLQQQRSPRKLIVVDASDDHGSVRRLVEQVVATSGIQLQLEVLESDPGSCVQRNLGLRHVDSPVVFLPDDDALWFPGYAEAVMAVYERDKEEAVGAVGGTESPLPPDGVLPGVRALPDGLTVHVPHIAVKATDFFERTFFPDPFFLEARALYTGKGVPPWLSEERARPVSTITGFRMSFRTELIKRVGFDEALGRYGLFEDHDACMSILRSHCLVTADRAKVFHFRQPEERADALELGIMHILNRAYILAKHAPAGFRLRPALVRYGYYKLFRYALRARSPAMRRRLAGAWRSVRLASLLCDSLPEDLAGQYVRFREACLSSGHSTSGRPQSG